MGILTNLNNRIKAASDTVEAIQSYIFDDFSQINANSQLLYPVCLVKPPQSIFPYNTTGARMEYQIFSMDMFVLLPEKDNDINTWTENWDICSDALHKIVKQVIDDVPNYVLMGDITWSIGHRLYNASLIGARAQFKLRVYYGC